MHQPMHFANAVLIEARLEQAPEFSFSSFRLRTLSWEDAWGEMKRMRRRCVVQNPGREKLLFAIGFLVSLQCNVESEEDVNM